MIRIPGWDPEELLSVLEGLSERIAPARPETRVLRPARAPAAPVGRTEAGA